jgi:tetratricopeptide (TPR) repeat protein
MGAIKALAGRAEESEADVRKALQISPEDPWTFVWMTWAGMAANLIARYDHAVEWLRRSLEANRNYPNTHFLLAAGLGNLGRLEEARASVAAGLALDPLFAIARYRAFSDALSDNPIYRAGRDRNIDGLRKAGVPEQ